MNKLLYMQRSTTANQQQRLQLSHAIRYFCNHWQQGALIILAFLFSLGAQARSGELPQDITLSFREATLDKVFKEIRKQTGYSFVYTESEISRANKVTIEVSNSSLDRVLSLCFQNQPLTYTIVDKIVVVKPRQERVKAVPVVNNLTAGNPKKISMRGRVMNEKGDPLAGATITVRRSDVSTTTNEEGYFSLSEIEEDAVLVVSSVGHVTQQVKLIAGKLNMEIKLSISVKDEEEVVVAYNKVSSRSNVGAVTVVKGEDVQNLPNRSVDKSLQGLVPGLLVTSGTGQPGGGLSNFVLRGIATGTAENVISGYSTIRNPLIVVDGIPVFQDAQITEGVSRGGEVPNNNPMAQLNPSDIESISILRDAAAIALYGATASNGVILITTKRGQPGKTRINFRSQVDIASRIKTSFEPVTQEEYMELLYETLRNSSPGITNDSITKYLKGNFPTKADGSFYPFTDLTPYLYNNRALTTSNELSLSGGNARSTFYLNFEWTKQDGIFKKTGFDRKSIRFNFDNRVTDWLKIGMNSTLSYNVQDVAFAQAAQYGSIFYAFPLNPIYLENGDYYANYKVPLEGTNPVAALEYNDSRNTSYRGLSKIFVELNFTKDLKLTSNFGIDYLHTEAKDRMDPRLADPRTGDIGLGRIQQASIRNANLITTNILSYNKTFRRHHGLNLLAGQEARMLNKQSLSVIGTDFLLSTTDQISQTATKESYGSEIRQTGLSYFGQANYDFKQKYFFSGSIRTDGYSQFGSRQPFNSFWSLGAGWIISAERFMEGTHSWLNYLKLRGSMGPAGNAAAINRFIKYQQLSTINYLTANNTALLQGSTPPNTLIQPEQTFTWNGGLELKAWNNRIGFTADIYRRKTTDLIYQINLPLSSGFEKVQDNLGDMVNSGIEISLSANIVKSKNFNWNLNANWSTNQNKLVKANSRLPMSVAGWGMANAEGHDFNSFYMPIWAGVDPATGLGMWMDSTGKPSTNYGAAKKEWVGKPQPDGFGSITNTFNYKGLSFSFQLYYQYGFQVYNADPKLTNDGATLFDNQSRQALDRWQKPGDIAANPRRAQFNAVYYSVSTRNLIDGDHIRLQTVSLGYNLPRGIIERLHLSSLKVYAQGFNLGLWATKKPPAQDIGTVNVQGALLNQYPAAKSFSFGINASF